MDKKVPPQEGNNHPTNTPMGLFPTADGFLNLAATSSKNFQKFCGLIDRETMAADPRFASTALRRQNKQALNALIADALRARTSRDWFEIMVAEGLPCGPVYDISEVFADPQVEALRIKRSVNHPKLGEIDLVAQPCEMSGFDRAIRTATPDLGQHTDEILQSLGYDADAINKLRAAQAI
jgi:crotonobetainyl-CoA:carnitine CoA-transferase CaiB-like acyl-CoA transferase